MFFRLLEVGGIVSQMDTVTDSIMRMKNEAQALNAKIGDVQRKLTAGTALAPGCATDPKCSPFTNADLTVAIDFNVSTFFPFKNSEIQLSL